MRARPYSTVVLPVALLASFLELPAGAGESVTPGETLQLSMPAGDPRTTRIIVQLIADADRVVTVEARSLDFEPLLQVFRDTEGGGRELLAGARRELAWDGNHVAVEVESGAGYTIEVRPLFEDWGGEVRLSVEPGAGKPLAPDAADEASRAYWEQVATRAEETGKPALQARAVLGRTLAPIPAPRVSWIEIVPPFDDAMYAGLRTSADRWRPDRRRMGLRTDLALELEQRMAGYARALGAYEQLLGERRAPIAEARLRLGVALLEAGSIGKAREQLLEATEILETSLGPEHPQMAVAGIGLGRLHRQTGDLGRAVSVLDRALAIAEARFGADSLVTSHAYKEQGLALWQAGRFEQAASALEQAIAIRERRLGSDHPYTMLLFRQVAMLHAYAELDDTTVPRTWKNVRRGTLPTEDGSLERLSSRFPRVLRAIREPFEATDLYEGLWNADFASFVFPESNRLARQSRKLQLRAVAEQVAGECRTDAASLVRCADQLLLWGNYADAQALYEEALVGREAAYGADHPVVADTLRDLVRVYLGLRPTIRAQLLQGMAEAPEVFKPEVVESSITGYPDLGTVLPLLQRVVDIREKSLPAEHLELGRSLRDLGQVLWRLGRTAEAEPLLERALQLLESNVGPSSLSVGLELLDLAVLHAETGDFEQARSAARRGRTILAEQLAPHGSLLAEQSYRLAWSMRNAGAYAEMEQWLESSAAATYAGPCLGSLHLRRNVLLADATARIGRLDEARELLLAEIERCDLDDRATSSLETVLSEDYEPGDKRRKKPQGLDEYLHGSRRRAGRAAAIAAYAVLFLPALAAGVNPGVPPSRKVHFGAVPAQDPRDAFYFETVGAVLSDSELHRESVAFLRGAIESMKTGVGAEHPSLAGVYQSLAESLWDIGAEDEKVRFEDEREALHAAVRAAKQLDDYLHGALAFLPESQALRLVSTRRQPENVLFAGLLYGDDANRYGWYRACWDWALRRRALVLDELAYRHQQSLGSESEEAARVWNEWTQARGRLAALSVQGPDVADPESYWNALDQAVRDREQAEAALAELSARFREAKQEGQPSLPQVVKAMPEGAALVEYVRVPVREREQRQVVPHYVALIVKGTYRRPRFADLGPAEPIDDLVREWHDRLSDSYAVAQRGAPLDVAEVLEKGDGLREVVWDPVVRQIDDAGLVFVVPDGSLHQLNLSALPAEGGGYVIEETRRIHLLSTARDVVRLANADPGSGEGLLAVGNPDYDAGRTERAAHVEGDLPASAFRGTLSPCGGLGEMRWSGLPESGDEALAIGEMFREREPVEVLTGAAASEERFKRDAPGKRMLHIATHGFFLQPECPAVESLGRAIGSADRRAVGENPLLLSGLVLAGANQLGEADPDGEDGILTAEELGALDLRGLEIAVLSACETGLGTVEAGEGVFGLRRALEVAGARTVLISLWDVPDRGTREWMEVFYRARLAGEPVLEASREATLVALENLRVQGVASHPYLWAGFVAAGDWR